MLTAWAGGQIKGKGEQRGRVSVCGRVPVFSTSLSEAHVPRASYSILKEVPKAHLLRHMDKANCLGSPVVQFLRGNLKKIKKSGQGSKIALLTQRVIGQFFQKGTREGGEKTHTLKNKS